MKCFSLIVVQEQQSPKKSVRTQRRIAFIFVKTGIIILIFLNFLPAGSELSNEFSDIPQDAQAAGYRVNQRQ